MRLLVLEDQPKQSPDFRVSHHFVALNLADAVDSEFCVEDGPWMPRLFGHHFFVFIPAGVQHAVRSAPDRVLLLEIDAQFGEGVLKICGESAPLRPLIGVDDPAVAHIMLALVESMQGDGLLEQMHSEALGAALLSRIALNARSVAKPPSAGGLAGARLHRVLEHIALHLDAPPSLRALADLAGMGLYRFVRAFKQSTGVSPHRYVLDARIAHAKELLCNASLSISEIALRTGFANPSHFALTFRRMTSLSPRLFRQRAMVK